MATSFSVETKNRFAICIGINGYDAQDQILPLRFAEQDAKDVHALLLAHGFDPQHTCLLLGEAATWEAIQHALTTLLLTKARKDDLVLFYFAGHGVLISINDEDEDEKQEPQSDVFLCSTNFDLQKMVDERGAWLGYPLRMQKLRTDVFEAARSRRVLFIFDSCHSGDFFGKHYRPRTSENLATRYIEQPFGKDSRGRLVLSSCLPHQTSREDERLGHGVFTYHLLQALAGQERQAISRSHEGWVTVGSLFDYLALKMPGNQRPVKSGAEHDAFRLVYYREYVEQPSMETHLPQEDALSQRRSSEKKMRLKAMMADHTGFMRDRLESFVGRETELSDIRQRIQEQMPSGGYVTITGQAGQGKSSVIAQLVKDAIAEQGSEERVAYHFIPFNPGPDHQVGLLRNLIARLMFKHDLSDLYVEYVAYGNRPALRDFFPRVLHEIAEKGQHEIIFVDGLDQIEEDVNGQRDLTFLPTEPPPGIVFVLGTRPDDTLRPLTLHKPYLQYKLPNLSRADFDRILHHRGISLSLDITDQFYRVMQENALFLDLVAKELNVARADIAPEEMIKRLANNPANLFSFAMERLQRTPEWEIIEQVLGLLLASREPLSLPQLRQIMSTKEYRLRSAIARLGGFLTESVPKDQSEHRHYSLFHRMFQDFLGQNEHESGRDYLFATSEVEQYHNRLAQWCEGEQLALIWQDTTDQVEQARRTYARQHYITHLYLAKLWPRLFDILDDGAYGRAKVQDDPSMRSYTLDLELGRLALASESWTWEQGIAHLPLLWRYTLLQCSLTSRADQYPNAAFQLLLLLRQEEKAIGLAELLTDTSRKVETFIQIATHLAKQPYRKVESDQMFIRANEVAKTIADAYTRGEALKTLGQALTQIGQWDRVEAVWRDTKEAMTQIAYLGTRGYALIAFGYALAQDGQGDRAEAVWREAEATIAQYIHVNKENVLQEFGCALAQAQQWEYAEAVIAQITNADIRVYTLSLFGQALAQAQLWERAEAVIAQISNAQWRGKGLIIFGQALAQAQQWERAKAVWREVEVMIAQITYTQRRDYALNRLGYALVQAQQWERAEAVIAQITDVRMRNETLKDLGYALTQAQQWERAEAVIAQITDVYLRENASKKLGYALTQTQQWERAEVVIAQISDTRWRAYTLIMFGQALAQAQLWERAEAVWREAEATIAQITYTQRRDYALNRLGYALAQAQLWERAEAVIAQIIDISDREHALSVLGQALAQAQLWERAEAVIAQIADTSTRCETLFLTIKALSEAMQYERGLAVVQRSWLQVITRDEALDLLQIAKPFLVLKPELGVAFFEAFAWVDAFLKG